MKLPVLFLSLFFLFSLLSALSADTGGKRWAAGLNYPGAHLRCFVTEKSAFEVKRQSEGDVSLTGARFYRYFSRSEFSFFAGLEMAFFSFKGDVTEGSGTGAELFLGGEYKILPWFSFQTDMGPALLSLSDDKDSSVSVSGIDFVLNMGFNFYW